MTQVTQRVFTPMNTNNTDQLGERLYKLLDLNDPNLKKSNLSTIYNSANKSLFNDNGIKLPFLKSITRTKETNYRRWVIYQVILDNLTGKNPEKKATACRILKEIVDSLSVNGREEERKQLIQMSTQHLQELMKDFLQKGDNGTPEIPRFLVLMEFLNENSEQFEVNGKKIELSDLQSYKSLTKSLGMDWLQSRNGLSATFEYAKSLLSQDLEDSNKNSRSQQQPVVNSQVTLSSDKTSTQTSSDDVKLTSFEHGKSLLFQDLEDSNKNSPLQQHPVVNSQVTISSDKTSTQTSSDDVKLTMP